METIAFIYIHGVHPDTQAPVPRGYSKGFHQLITRELKRLGHETESIKRFEVNWSAQTFRLKQRAVELQFDRTPRRRGKAFLRSTLRNFVYPFAMDILHYAKNKGDDSTQASMPVIEEIHKMILKVKEQSISKIVLLAHSLGSVACYDYVFRFDRRYPFPSGVKIKALATFGSPIPLFVSGMGYPVSTRIRKPAYIHKWVNLWDHDDPISGRIMPHLPKSFSRGFFKDILVNTALINPAKAHSGYWKNRKVARSIAKEVF